MLTPESGRVYLNLNSILKLFCLMSGGLHRMGRVSFQPYSQYNLWPLRLHFSISAKTIFKPCNICSSLSQACFKLTLKSNINHSFRQCILHCRACCNAFGSSSSKHEFIITHEFHIQYCNQNSCLLWHYPFSLEYLISYIFIKFNQKS